MRTLRRDPQVGLFLLAKIAQQQVRTQTVVSLRLWPRHGHPPSMIPAALETGPQPHDKLFRA